MNYLYRGSIRTTGGTGGDSEVPNDKTLSDILDEVIENMPYNDRSAPDVNVILDLESNRPLRSDYAVSSLSI